MATLCQFIFEYFCNNFIFQILIPVLNHITLKHVGLYNFIFWSILYFSVINPPPLTRKGVLIKLSIYANKKEIEKEK